MILQVVGGFILHPIIGASVSSNPWPFSEPLEHTQVDLANRTDSGLLKQKVEMASPWALEIIWPQDGQPFSRLSRNPQE